MIHSQKHVRPGGTAAQAALALAAALGSICLAACSATGSSTGSSIEARPARTLSVAAAGDGWGEAAAEISFAGGLELPDAREELAPLVVERGEDLPPLVIPRDEVLTYSVRLDVAVLGKIKVGNFRLTSLVEPFSSGLPLGEETPEVPEGAETGRITAEAWGEHLGYELDHDIAMTWQPVEWPRVVYRDVQRGSENRERELRYGFFEGALSAWYRSDRHCSGCEREEHFLEGTWFTDAEHCKKCRRAEHRVWREPQLRSIEPASIDMLGAVYLAREMVRTGVERLEFPLLDREDTWQVELRQGRRVRREVPAGKYLCREVKMATRMEGAGGEEFEGLFGIQGTISIWLHAESGVPVEISGTVPLGPMKFEMSIGLRKAEGTPPGFE